ncbi:MAG: hypothetical protein WC783_00265 [Candidatus Paceibacterota bacterium]
MTKEEAVDLLISIDPEIQYTNITFVEENDDSVTIQPNDLYTFLVLTGIIESSRANWEKYKEQNTYDTEKGTITFKDGKIYIQLYQSLKYINIKFSINL